MNRLTNILSIGLETRIKECKWSVNNRVIKTPILLCNESKNNDNQFIIDSQLYKIIFKEDLIMKIYFFSFDFYLYQIVHLLPEKSRSMAELNKVIRKSDGSSKAF
jgi:hypothetical protein